jgi:protocatechuate 3,4-dioxygenase beta subunit
MKGSTVVAIIAGAGLVGGVVYLATRSKAQAPSPTPTPTGTVPASINLTGPTTATPGSTITLTAVVLDANGNPVPNYTTYLDSITTNQTSQATTDSTGTATFSITFPSNASGDYTFQAYCEV